MWWTCKGDSPDPPWRPAQPAFSFSRPCNGNTAAAKEALDALNSLSPRSYWPWGNLFIFLELNWMIINAHFDPKSYIALCFSCLLVFYWGKNHIIYLLWRLSLLRSVWSNSKCTGYILCPWERVYQCMVLSSRANPRFISASSLSPSFFFLFFQGGGKLPTTNWSIFPITRDSWFK